MGEVSGRHHADALACRPMGEVLEVEIAARGARIFRMDVKVRVEAHGDATPEAGTGPGGESNQKRIVRLETPACGRESRAVDDYPTGPVSATRSPSMIRRRGQLLAAAGLAGAVVKRCVFV